MITLVLDQINRLHNVRMVQGGGDTEFGSEFLHIFFLRFVLATLAELLTTHTHTKRTPKKKRVSLAKGGWGTGKEPTLIA